MLRRTIETIGAGFVVYVLMAACSGTGQSPGRQHATAGASTGGQDGSGGLSEPEDAGLLEDVANPVPDAMAAGGGVTAPTCDCPEPYTPPAPVIVEAECDTIAEGTPTQFAVAEFPGKSAEDLAGLVAQVTYPDGLYHWGQGFNTMMVTPIVKDGAATVGCGAVGKPDTLATRVVFILH